MGLGINGLDQSATENLFRIKKREFDKPLYLLSYSISHILEYVNGIPDYAYELMKKYFPGPLTLILRCRRTLWTTPLERGDTLGVRIPACKPLINFLAYIDLPILNTSANVSHHPPLLTKEDVEKYLSSEIFYVPFEYNIAMSNIPSTIVDCTGDKPIVLRKGVIEI